jgi:hypothetical protein
MYTVFHGWRRKLGCVSLVMALVSMGLWIRGRVVVDAITFNDLRHSIANSPNGFEWTRRAGGQSPMPQFMNLSWNTISLDDSNFESFPEAPMGWETSWNYHWCGFPFGKFQLTADPLLSLVFAEFATWTIPHWAVVVPLTLLSAYLMLRKPWTKSQA